MLDPQASRFGQAAILSGLMDVEGLIACWNAIPPGKRDDPQHIDRRLARQAVLARALTLWQAQQILAGRTSGFKVDRYILLEMIGQGGMGRVYLARDTRLNRRVALKILAPERMNNPRAVARFQREARVGAQLQHENLVRIYDFGTSNGRYFLVMEFIEGKTIGHLLGEQGPMPSATAARLAQQVALGLGHAHRKGLIHRDVNPFNILVTHEGVAKLADLGLAIDLTEGDRVTREGATVGTFDYVAPEQARHSHSADIRSDIYSLGCTLYHMLSGQVPFPSSSLPEKLFAHQATEPTPLEQLVPGVPAGLASVVRSMMRKLPEERYSTPAQVVQALEPYVDEGPAAIRGQPGRLSSEPPPRPAFIGDPAAAPAAGLATASPAIASTPGSPQPDGARALAATVAGSDPAPSAPRPFGAAAVAGAPSTSGSDLDDPAIPLLTPTDDVADETAGLPIVLDLGPEPLLGKSAARPPRSRIAAAFSRAAGPAATTAGPSSETTDPAPIRPAGRPSPAWVRGSIVPAVLAVASIALLAFVVVKLGGPRPQPPAPPPPPRANPEVKDPARRPHPARKGEPDFVVRSYSPETADEAEIAAGSLKDAVNAAMGMGRGKNGYVEVRNHEPVRLDAGDFIDMVSTGGALDIRAAPGTRPVIEVPMVSSRSFLATGSTLSLSLSGLTIRVRYTMPQGATPPTSWPPLIQAAGTVKIERCAFEVAGPLRPDACRALFADGGNLTLNRCWFHGFDEAIGVRAFDATVTRISQTMIVPGPGPPPASSLTPELRGWALGVEIMPGAGAPGPLKRSLTLDHCTIEGAGLLNITGDAGSAPLPANVTHCAVRADALLTWQPRKPGDRLDADLQWQGLGNQFHILGRAWVVRPAGTTSPAPPPAVTDLASWSNFVVRESEPNQPRILYHTDPHARTDPPRPQDLAIESGEPLAARAGADPEQVGPWGK